MFWSRALLGCASPGGAVQLGEHLFCLAGPCTILPLDELESVTRLRHLILNLYPDFSFDSFPSLEHLQTLRVISPKVSAEQLQMLQERLPNCDIIIE